MRSVLAAVMLGTLLAVTPGCGKPRPAKASREGEARPQPKFVPVEPVRELPPPPDESGDRERQRIPLPATDDDEAASAPAVYSGRFYVNAPDDPGPANQEYAQAEVPRDSLASRLGRGVSTPPRWRPRWLYQGTGGVSLTAVALSGDGSVLALAETAVTAPGKPEASVVALLDTYRWSFLHVHEFPGKRIVRLAFVPGRARLVAVAERQPEAGQPQEILLLNLRQGSVAATGTQVRAPVVGLVAVEGDGLLVLAEAASGQPGGLWRLTTGEPEAAPTARQTEIGGSCLAVSANRNRIAVAGPNGVVFAGVGDLHRRQTVPTPGLTRPQALVFIDGPEDLALLGVGQPLLVLVGGQVRQLADRAGAVLAYNADEKRLLAALEKSNSLALYQLPDGELLGDCEPGRLKPTTKGAPWAAFWLKHLEKYLVVDTHGNVCLYHQPSRKWRKEVILDAKQ